MPEQVPEKTAADTCGCEFRILPFLQGRSTTGILAKGMANQTI